MSRFPETFLSMKAKMNTMVSFAIENMNTSLEDLCNDKATSPKVKLKATQEYLALYMKLENEIQREKESKEMMKQRRLNTKIKEAEVANIENPTGGVMDEAVKQSKFSPTMSTYN
jgi:hypothetical protein